MKSLSKSNKNAVQIVGDIRSIWSLLDPDMSVTKNRLADPELLEDHYFMVHLGILKTQQDVELSKQTPHMKATTIQSKLRSIFQVIKFSKLRFSFIGMTYQDMEIICLKIEQLIELLKPYRLERFVIFV